MTCTKTATLKLRCIHCFVFRDRLALHMHSDSQRKSSSLQTKRRCVDCHAICSRVGVSWKEKRKEKKDGGGGGGGAVE